MTSKLVRARVAAVLVGLAIAIPASGGAGRISAASKIAIENFGRIDTNYFRGAQPEGRDYADLAALGVKIVINLTSDDAQPNERSMVESAGMKYVQIPMTTHQPPTPAQIAQFMKIVGDMPEQPVYVHCVGGSHRTGVMTAVYRMVHDSWTADQAFAEMKKYKFGMDFLHPEFKSFVYSYQPAAKPTTVIATQVAPSATPVAPVQ